MVFLPKTRQNSEVALFFDKDMPRKELFLLLTLSTVNLMHIVDFMIMMPLGDQLMHHFAVGPQAFSMLVSAYTLSAFVSGLLGTLWLDHFDRKTALLILYVGFLFGTLACAFAPTYGLLLAARVLTGAFGGIIASLVLAIVGDVIPEERRGHAMGVITASFSLASIAGVPLGLLLAASYSWHAPFWMLGLLGLPLFFFLYVQIPPMSGHLHIARMHRQPLAGFSSAWANPRQRLGLMFMFTMSVAHFMVVPFIAPTMIANVGLSQQEISYIYVVGGIASVLTGPWIGKMADRFGKGRVFTIFIFLSILPMIVITNMGKTPLLWVLIMAAFFFIISGGRYIPAQATVTGLVAQHERGRFMSLLSAVQNLATASATLLSGAIITRHSDGYLANYPTVGVLSTVFLVVTYLIYVRLGRAQTTKTTKVQAAVV